MSTDGTRRIAVPLRALALGIAIAGVVDPALTRMRSGTRQVALLRTDSREDSVVATQVRERLGRSGFQAVDAIGPHDAARIVIGAALPSLDTLPVPTFVFTPDPVAVTDVRVPARVRPTSQVPVEVTLRATREASVTVELLDAAVVVARDRVALATDSTATRTLVWAPASLGTHALTVRVTTDRDARPARVTRAVLVDSTRWRVLAFDARPSWNATFLRRALERDRRFDVRSRVVAVRTPQTVVARTTARAPSSLAALDPHTVDVLVIGAPEALPSVELTALRRLVASDGVPVVLLPDDASPLLAQWLATGAWRSEPRREPVSVRPAGRVAADSALFLRALVVSAPVSLSNGSDTLLALGTQPVVWRQPIGAGEVVVSGALDAWRFRDPAQSGFDRVWRDLVAEQAARRAAAVAVWPEALSLHPAQRRPLTITASAAPRATWISGSGEAVAVPVAPTRHPTTWAALTPPVGVGEGTIHIVSGGDSALVPISVQPDAASATSADLALQRAWANATRGQVVTTIDSLLTAVGQAADARSEPLPWHPMRSPWWIVPFALALGVDWWLSRRNGSA